MFSTAVYSAAIPSKYIDLKNAWGNGRMRRTRGHLGCRPPKHEAAYSVDEAAYICK